MATGNPTHTNDAEMFPSRANATAHAHTETAAKPWNDSRMRSNELSHSLVVGYIFWILGFTGAHRFFFGKPLTGALWFFTGGLLLVGWIVDLFLVPSMAEEADARYPEGPIDYNLAWLLLMFLGLFGAHRFYMGKYITGAIYLVTGGLFGVGYVYDILTLNTQIADQQY